MDDRIRQEVSQLVAELAKNQQEKLAVAGTFVEIEKLTAPIGDEVALQLANSGLRRRAGVLCEQPTHACPDCRRDFFPSGRPPGKTAARERCAQ